MEHTKIAEFIDPPGVYGTKDTVAIAAAHDSSLLHLRAAQACIACRKQKRKCDKALPSCSLCSRMSRSCDYSDSTPTPNADDFAVLRQKVADLEAKLEAKNGQFARASPFGHQRNGNMETNNQNGHSSTFPTLFFLDAEIFSEAKMSIPASPPLQIPSDVLSALGSPTDVRDVAERYFENIHLWLPIVSKKRMQITLSNPRFEMTPDLSLLLLGMKLVMQSSNGSPQDAQNPLYHMVKRHLALVESSAVVTLQLLQSTILVAAYEIGHGIYPAAYLSTGHCARMGYMFGLHDLENALQILPRSGAWAGNQERKRCWWACMLLDRFVNLGSPCHPLATEDPSPSMILPADDDAWDQGEMITAEPLYVSTPTPVHAGPFARTAQATNLLGKLVRTVNGRFTDTPFCFSEAIQLYRTFSALAALLVPEFQQSPLQYATPMALCYTGLLHLCDPYCCTERNKGEHTVEESEMQTLAIGGMKQFAGEALQFSYVLKMAMTTNMAAISPLTADAIYVAAATFAWYAHESGSANLVENYRSLRETLVVMNSRWAVAGEYLKALDVAEDVLYRSTPVL